MTDSELLQRYGRDGSEEAFATLVRRHVDLVYSAARRQVSVPHLAEDVTQAVFIELARHAARWRPAQPVGAWLYVVTRRTAIDAMRRESRRAARELAAVDLPAMPTADDPWNDIRPLLDAAMASLGERDRTAIVGRFFENKNFRDVARDLGASEDAAQKRVTRALDQLRVFFAARGITVTAGGLAGTLSAQAVSPAPAAFVAQLAASSGNLAGTLAAGAAAPISFSKIAAALGFAGASAAAVLLAIVLARQHAALAETRAQFATASARFDALRRERDADLTQLRAAQSTVTSAAPDPDASLRAEIRAWTGRIEHLKKILKRRPDLALPEMALLADEDWRSATRERSFATDQDVGDAILALRNHARAALGFNMIAALDRYLREHDATLPPDVSALAPYFKPPLDPAILARYEMLHQGKLSAVPLLDPADEKHASHSGRTHRDDSIGEPSRAAVIGERPELLLPEDGRLKVGPQSYAVVDELATNLTPFEGRSEKAAAAYMRAHGGAMPQQPAEVLPYFDPPLSAAEQQKIVALLRIAERTGQNPFRDLKP